MTRWLGAGCGVCNNRVCDDTRRDRCAEGSARGRARRTATGRGKGLGRRGNGGASEAFDREDEARPVWAIIRTRAALARPVGVAARGAGGERGRGRGGHHPGRHHINRRFQPQEAGARALAGPSAARARGDPRAEHMPVLRRQARQTGRGHHRDAGGGAAAVEGNPDRQGEVHLSALREDHPAAVAVPSDCPGAGRRQPLGDDPVRQVRRAPAAQPTERELCPRRDRSRHLDLGGLGRRLRRRADAAGRADPVPRLGRRTPSWRRHDRAGTGEEQDRDGEVMDLCPGRSAVRRPGPAGGNLLLLAQPQRRASRPASRRLCRDPPGRRLCRVRRALRCQAKAGADYRGGLLGPRPAQLLRTGRSEKGPTGDRCRAPHRIADHPGSRLDQLLPWNWKNGTAKLAA